MDRRRLALIRGGDAAGFHRVGTGYLIGPRLVLTARHVVEESKGMPWAQIDVRVGHPRDADVHRCPASVRWTHPEGRDVALLLLDDAVELPGTVRWGRPVGNTPLSYQGLGYPSATFRDGQHKVEYLSGKLPPQAGGVGAQDLYVLDQEAAPDMRANDEQAWSGASGGAVFCQDHLVGVAIHDDHAFANRRLHACPARTFISDPAFATLLQRYGDGPPELVDITATPTFEAARIPEGPGREVDSQPTAKPTAPVQGRTDTKAPFSISWTGKDPLSAYTDTRQVRRAVVGLTVALAVALGGVITSLALGPDKMLAYAPGHPDGWMDIFLVSGGIGAICLLILLAAAATRFPRNKSAWSLQIGPPGIRTTSGLDRREYRWSQVQTFAIEETVGNARSYRCSAGLHIKFVKGDKRSNPNLYRPAGWPFPHRAIKHNGMVPVCVLGPMTDQQRTALREALARYGHGKSDAEAWSE